MNLISRSHKKLSLSIKGSKTFSEDLVFSQGIQFFFIRGANSFPCLQDFIRDLTLLEGLQDFKKANAILSVWIDKSVTEAGTVSRGLRLYGNIYHTLSLLHTTPHYDTTHSTASPSTSTTLSVNEENQNQIICHSLEHTSSGSVFQ